MPSYYWNEEAQGWMYRVQDAQYIYISGPFSSLAKAKLDYRARNFLQWGWTKTHKREKREDNE